MAAKKLSEKDVETLATFLVDRNARTVDLAKEHLKTILRANPGFRKILENAADPQVAHEARVFLEETRMADLFLAFQTLARQGQNLDLEHGAYLLARLAFPALTPEEVARPLNRMAEELDEILDAEEPAPAQEVRFIQKYLFEEMGFRGNDQNYYDPDNSFINRVLERRTGIPISLSLVYLLVAERLDMRAFGIGLPGHFIIGHGGKPGAVYLDPYQGGRFLTRNDCIELVRRRGMAFQEAFLEPTPNSQILARMMVNLMTIYTERGATARAQWLGRVVPLFQES